MIRLTITIKKSNEHPIAKTFDLPEDLPLSIAEIKEKFVPVGYSLAWWTFDRIGLF